MAKKVAKKVARPPHEATEQIAETGNAGPMSVPLLRQLVRLMSDNDLTSLELRDGEQRIALSRGGPPAPPMPASDAPPPPAPMRRDPAAPQQPSPAAEPAAASNLVEIKSPMVGTFYNSPSPDAKAFVQVGDKVGPDTDVCIIEAMKVFNNIKAETSGTVEKMLVDSGQSVEFGQVLFLVKP